MNELEPTSSEATVLVVDDDGPTRDYLRECLEQVGCRVLEAADGRAALETFDEQVDLVLLDSRLPDVDGVSLVEPLKKVAPEAAVIVMTSYSNVNGAVAAMQKGAFTYAEKPMELSEMMGVVKLALQSSRAIRGPRSAEVDVNGYDRLIGNSDAMSECKNLIRKVAAAPNTTLLLSGETGSGKDLAARVIHSNGLRARRPFIHVTCSARPEQLLESELFGHERSPNTDTREIKRGLLECADGGTVYLDEVTDLPMSLQAKLLRYLEEHCFRRMGGFSDVSVDVRVIAASSVDLEKAVEAGRLRTDLYHRLRVMQVGLPALRDRRACLRPLISYFISQLNRELRKIVRGVSAEAMGKLECYRWPGNVRELKNLLERAVLLAETDYLMPDDFPALEAAAPEAAGFSLPAAGISLQELERQLVIQALERTEGNRTGAAKLLGLNRDQMRYRVEKFGLSTHRFGKG